MPRLIHRQLQDIATAIRAEAEWWLHHQPGQPTNAQRVADRANADVNDAIKSTNHDGTPRCQHELTTPEQHAEHALNGKTDTTAKRIHQINGLIREAKLNLRDARRIANQIITTNDTHDLNEVHKIANITATAGRGHCENCGRWTEGTRTDRLIRPTTSDTHRAGAIYQCPTCLKYWQRNNQLRPPRLWAIEDDLATA